MSNASDFVIEKGILTKYVGPGGDVIVPDGVTSIGFNAFHNCTDLASITLPDSVTEIGDWAFKGCASLKSITFPDSLTSIGRWAFHNCTSLTSITLPKGLKGIDSLAFEGCTSLTSITLPMSLTSIGGSVFRGCTSLTNITIPEGVTSIDSSAFDGCTSLTRITLPKGLAIIGDMAFHNCKSLTSITLPESLGIIGSWSFDGCEELRNITLPTDLKLIGRQAFRDTAYFKTPANWQNGVLYIGSALVDTNESLKELAVKDGVTCIADAAFVNCKGLTSIVLPDGLTSISGDVFCNCKNLKYVTMPASVTSIGEAAFRGCTKLKSINMTGSKAKLTKDIFGYNCALPTGLIPQIDALYLYMADGALKQYVLTKTVWKKLDPALRAEIFLSRQGKALDPAYKKIIDAEQLEPLGRTILQRLESDKPGSKDCTAAAAYMTQFHETAPVELLRSLYEKLKQIKAGAKAVKTVEDHILLMEKLGGSMEIDASLPPVERRVMELLTNEKRNVKDQEARQKEYYGIAFRDLPELKTADDVAAAPYVLAWLLTAHEELVRGRWDQTDVDAAYEKPGLRPEVAEVVALLDPDSLQAALIKLADENLGLTGRSKKMFLAFPICRYADESVMEELAKRAPKWRSSVSGNDAPPLLNFRKASLYSNAHAAMLFAERYHELDKYAALRGMTEDELRDQYLSDVGLDEQGGKVYDLCNQTVTARLQKDLSFLFELPDGKTAKSLPKKGADPVKYEAANKDFSEMKKAVKKILNSRGKALFEDFLSGRTRPAADWQSAYLPNPLLREAASLVVWAQGKKTFTLRGGAPIDSAEQPYTITDKPIRVAHPMEMEPAESNAWQKYFTAHGLKQPFQQIWEPVRKASEIRADRYAGCVVEIYQLNGKDKHGIHSYGLHAYSEDFGFELDDCHLEAESSTWRLNYDGAAGETYTLGAFKFKKFTRKVNHIVAILDGLTVAERVRKDDLTVMDLMPGFTLAQITEFIAAAQEAGATNVLTALLEYKNAHFAGFDPMDEFTLEW